jgi:hypothetical protein
VTTPWLTEAERFYELETSLDVEALERRLEAGAAGVAALGDAVLRDDEARAFLHDAATFAASDAAQPALRRGRVALPLALADHVLAHGPWQDTIGHLALADEAGGTKLSGELAARREALLHRYELRAGDRAALDAAGSAAEAAAWKLAYGKFRELASETDASWEGLVSRSILAGDFYEVARAVLASGGAPHATPQRKLDAYSWMTAAEAAEDRARLPQPTSVRKSSFVVAEADGDLREAYALASALQACGERATTGDALGRSLLGLMDDAARFLRLERELLALYGVYRMAVRARLDAVRAEAVRRIAARSRACSAGTTADLWGLLDMASTTTPARPAARRRGMLALGTAVTTRLALGRLREAFAAADSAAQIRADTLAHIGATLAAQGRDAHGALQKIFQIAAGLEGLLPEELRARITPPPVRGRRIAPATVEKLVGDANRAAEGHAAALPELVELAPEPFAFGAIGQVHRGRLADGTAVAVKVRYPDIEAQIRDDFRALRRAGWLAGAVVPHQDWGAVVAQWQEWALAECDYDAERATQAACAAVVATVPGPAGSCVMIPRVHGRPSGADVLTQDFVDGIDLEAYVAGATQRERDSVGVALVRGVWALMWRGYFNHDVHPGNFRFAGDRCWMLDFGLCFTPETRHRPIRIAATAQVIASGQDEVAKQWLAETDLYPADTDFAAVLARTRELYLRPFLRDEVFTFTPDFARAVARGMLVEEHHGRKAALPRTEQMVIVRFYWSFYSLLARLGATANWYRVAREMDEVFGKGE